MPCFIDLYNWMGWGWVCVCCTAYCSSPAGATKQNTCNSQVCDKIWFNSCDAPSLLYPIWIFPYKDSPPYIPSLLCPPFSMEQQLPSMWFAHLLSFLSFSLWLAHLIARQSALQAANYRLRCGAQGRMWQHAVFVCLHCMYVCAFTHV